MKRILFIIRDFKQGGIPRCLQTLINHLNGGDFEIDVLCLYQEGPYTGRMTNCHVLEQDKVMFHLLKFGRGLSITRDWLTYLYKAINVVAGKVTGRNLMQRIIRRYGRELSGRYDAVIAYSEGVAAQFASEIASPKKFVWIHNDYSFDCARGDNGTTFDCFDKIVCVSEASRRSFVSVFPEFDNKTVVIYNIIDDSIAKLVNNHTPDEFDNMFFNIVSVGRICFQKNFTLIPELIGELTPEVRDNMRWFIIGDGPADEVDLLRQKIRQYDVAENVIMLGNRDNPYPYIGKADLFVLTSRYESYPTVINEALVLGTAIIAIDIPPVHEMIDPERIVQRESMPEAISAEFRNRRPKIFWGGAKEHNNRVIAEFSNLINN